MHTTDITTAPDPATDVQPAASEPSTKPGWPTWAMRTLAWLTTTGRNIERFVTTDPGGAARLAGAALGAVLTALLAVGIVVKFLTWLVYGHPEQDLAQLLPAARIATAPVGHWLAAHTTGLPLTTQAAAWIWGGLGVLLLAAATGHHLGARLLWPFYGAATAAMAWFGTDTAAHRPIAVGLLAAAWSVLSLLAWRGRRLELPASRTDTSSVG